MINAFFVIDRGSGTIDVAMTGLDVNQCDSVGKFTDAFHNAFKGTHKCPSYTKVWSIEGKKPLDYYVISNSGHCKSSFSCIPGMLLHVHHISNQSY